MCVCHYKISVCTDLKNLGLDINAKVSNLPVRIMKYTRYIMQQYKGKEYYSHYCLLRGLFAVNK